MDHLFSTGTEVAFRLGYDDVNESLTQPDNVLRVLGLLGVKRDAACSGNPNGAHDAITQLGVSAAGGHLVHDPKEAAAWWSTHVFDKTFRERRSWAAIYRAFYRVYAVHFLLMHLLIAYAFAGNNLLVSACAGGARCIWPARPL